MKLDPVTNHVYYGAVFAGSRGETVSAVAVDQLGNAYLAGNTSSYDFPTVRPLQRTCGDPRGMNSCSDGFLVKLDPEGRVLYSTYLGGKGDDRISGIAINRWGEAYVAGSSTSLNFPVRHALQPHLRGTANAFVARIDSTGQRLLYSTYLGGSRRDGAAAIAVDRWGQAFVTGTTTSADLRTSAHAIQPQYAEGTCFSYPCEDAWVAKLGLAGRFLAGTYLGTKASDYGSAVAVDGSGSVYVAGATGADTIPGGVPTTSTTKPLCGSEGDMYPCFSAFVVKLSPWLDRHIYTRMFSGDGYDEATSIAVTPTGAAFVGGYTESTNFPTESPVQAATGGGECPVAKGASAPCDGFVAAIAPKGSGVTFSTYIGGEDADRVESIAVGKADSIIFAGTTGSTNLPVTIGSAPLAMPKLFLGQISSVS
jgi:hypothetical protein